jgi:hypothetical protein
MATLYQTRLVMGIDAATGQPGVLYRGLDSREAQQHFAQADSKWSEVAIYPSGMQPLQLRYPTKLCPQPSPEPAIAEPKKKKK